MPTTSTFQTVGMPMAPGTLAPGLDGNGFINPIAYKRNVVAKTAAYTVKTTESGTIFTTRGATAGVTFTLPAVANSTGCEFTFIAAADYAMTVASAEGDNIVITNDAAADSVAFSTAAEIIGGAVTLISDGAVWYTLLHVNETQTPVIAT